MRIYALVVTKNEADRYLQPFLSWHSPLFDGIAFFDDQSNDGTAAMCANYGRVKVRSGDVPAFMEHEGQFRQAAWEWLELSMAPVPGDWVVCIDTDEFLVCDQRTLPLAARNAERDAYTSISIPIPEVWTVDSDNRPSVRIDGWWDGLAHPRMVAYRPEGKFNDFAMASGSVPTYALDNVSMENFGITILHYGYARPEDRIVKTERYRGIRGHNPQHIESILQKPKLRTWDGEYPFLSKFVSL